MSSSLLTETYLSMARSSAWVLQWFVGLLPEIKIFLSAMNQKHEELSDDAWLLDLGSLTDLRVKVNTLNNELQGKDWHLPHMMRAVNAVTAKIGIWTTHLKNGRFNLEKMSQAKDAFEFSWCFVEDIAVFVSNPFLPTDIEQAAAKFQQVFALPHGVDKEMRNLQNDIQ